MEDRRGVRDTSRGRRCNRSSRGPAFCRRRLHDMHLPAWSRQVPGISRRTEGRGAWWALHERRHTANNLPRLGNQVWRRHRDNARPYLERIHQRPAYQSSAAANVPLAPIVPTAPKAGASW